MRALGKPSLASWLSSLTLAVFLGAAFVAVPSHSAFAEQEDADEAVEDREERDRKEAANERSEKIKRDFIYKRSLEANMMTIGPYNINVRVDGKPVHGYVSFAVEADTIANRALLENYKTTLDSVVFPHAIQMFKSGRPGPRQVENFKENAMEDLIQKFGQRVKDIFVYQIL